MDFSHELCRAVMFIGIPYPNINDPWIIEKKQYLNTRVQKFGQENSISGDQWYELETIRAVNQALGRVIRNQEDYGAIFLFDNRYEERRILSRLPGWTKNSLEIINNFDDAVEQTEIFFKHIGNKYYRASLPEIDEPNKKR